MAAVVRAESFDHVKIAVREKPLSEDERSGVQVVLRPDNDKLVAFYPDSREGLVYNYDYLYPEEATQLDVFQTIGQEMVELVMGGYSSTCVVYGPSATGKTHTLFGSDQEPGLIQLATKELFQKVESSNGSLSLKARFSYWEMNCDTICDALGDKKTLNAIRRNETGVVVPGLTEVDISSWEELDELLMQGNIRRIQLSEQRNARWHGFVKLFIDLVSQDAPESQLSSTMTFAHLKGPDRVGQKGAKGDVMKHGSNINKSITLLGSAILHSLDYRRSAMKTDGDASELMEKSQSFFMESKFTQMLARPFCGAEATFVIGCVCTLDYHETTDTLENLQNMQQIVCTLKQNATLTTEGVTKQKLHTAESMLPCSNLAEGHPPFRDRRKG